MTAWTICILTVPEREQDLTRIAGMLNRQIEEAGARGDVDILVHPGDGSIASKRQWCLDNARGTFVNFIDDDDIVAYDYVQRIYELLDPAIHYVGFQLQYYEDGVKWAPTFHSLRYGGWYSDERGHYRNVSHLNPTLTSLARRARFEGGYGEDHRWAESVAPYLTIERYVDVGRPIYFYFHSSRYSLSGRW